MRLALRLAAKGIGAVEPNPAVGCVIAQAGHVIGRGYHKRFGGPHAEINALADCRKRGANPAGGTLYVTLEPCCHQGKTGPCTDAVIEAGIARMVAATTDPSAHACGKGLEQLRRAGIEVEVGLCGPEARQLNAPFFKHVVTDRPWVILKWAQSIDGKLAYVDQSAEKRWISNEASRHDAHRLRRRAGAIVVGINTILADDPLLTPRPAKGRKPIRVVLDGSLRLPLGCRLLRTVKTSPVLIYARQAALDAHPSLADQIRKKGAELLLFDKSSNATADTEPSPEDTSNIKHQTPNLPLPFLLAELGKRGVQQVLVEGGPHVAASFLREGLVDEVCIYLAAQILGAVGTAPLGESLAGLEPAIRLHGVQIRALGDDVCLRGFPADDGAREGIVKNDQH